ncbi:MAG: hypothetical protein WCF57_00460 [Pyrinomonadaceae bacterium]
MNKNFVTSPLLALALIMCLSAPSLADTIRLKDGSVIRGQVVGFKDQQFTVLVGAGARGRRSTISLYMEDIESIEFESTANAGSVSPTINDDASTNDNTIPQPTQTTTRPNPPPRTNTTQSSTNSQTGGTVNTQPSSRNSPTFFQINARVRADNASNGWTNTGLVVRRGQRLRVTATGRVSLGAGRASTPAGLPTLPDRDKLMRNEATGGIIAVIGDDNDDFIFIGRNRDFIAQRDGVLFLGVNEGNLADNTGAYDAVIEAEAIATTTR